MSDDVVLGSRFIAARMSSTALSAMPDSGFASAIGLLRRTGEARTPEPSGQLGSSFSGILLPFQHRRYSRIADREFAWCETPTANPPCQESRLINASARVGFGIERAVGIESAERMRGITLPSDISFRNLGFDLCLMHDGSSLSEFRPRGEWKYR